MKKITLFIFAVVLTGCTQDSKQADAVKSELVKSFGVSQSEADSYTYTVNDAYAKEVYNALIAKTVKESEHYAEVGDLEKATKTTKKMDSLMLQQTKDKEKKFYAVHVYKLRDKDTIKNTIYFVDDMNKLVAVKSK